MFPILEAHFLSPDVKLSRIEAPRIARKRQAGQFVILRVHEHGERIPITIADSNAETGTITIVVQGLGKTTKLLNSLDPGDAILDVVGPLGKPSEIERFGTTFVIGGGVARPSPTRPRQQAANHGLHLVHPFRPFVFRP